MSSSENTSVRLETRPGVKSRSPSSSFGIATSLSWLGVRRKALVNCNVVSRRTAASPLDHNSAASACSTQAGPCAMIAAVISRHNSALRPHRCDRGLALLAALVLIAPAHAGVSPEQAARLRGDLTPMGAERAGSNDGV